MNNTARHVRAGGSVLIMVIGVLTILFMLGATFLAVSHMNAKQSAALAEKAPADPAALGVLTTLVDQMRADLAFSTTGGRYTNTAGGVDAWKSFIDCPMVDETAVPKRSDPWLACTELLTAGGTIPFISDPTLQWVGTATKDFSATGFGAVDTDGDGYMDSRLYDTGITNDNGEHYWAAVCVRDASALLNVNVAAGPWPAGAADAPSYTSPIAVDLAGFLPNYASLHNTIGGANSRIAAAMTSSDFNKCAAMVMSPSGNYQPYAIGDETFLRFIGTAGGQYASNFVGRLYESNAIAVKGNLGAQANRRLLTTYNGSSQIGRTGLAAAVVHNLDITAGGASYDLVNSSTVRDLVYDRVESFLSQAGLGGSSTTETGIMAASFVANLWAYLDSPALAKAPWAYNRNNVTAYGTIPGCVITEVFAGSTPDTGANDWAYCFAIEVWNPTSGPITFRIPESDNTPYTLAANERRVYAWYEDGGSGDYAILGLPSNPLKAGWIQLSATAGSDFRSPLAPAQRRVSVVRVDSSGNSWPSIMDTASAEDAGYPHSVLSEGGLGELPHIGRRDDSPHRARYNVAAYKTDNVHNLGTPNVNNPNALNPADVDAKAAYPYPIVSLMGGVRDIGELNRIYFAAATNEPGKKRAFSQNVAKDTAVGSTLFGLTSLTPGRLDLRGGIGGGAFPDVPLASALGEYLTLTPGDTTRLDNPNRVYGKVNVNTATREVLRRIFPASATTLPQFKACDDSTIPASAATIDWDRAVEFILAYREQRAVVPPGTGNVSYVNRDSGSNVPNLRTASKFNGFLTAGEVAIPLADYAHELMGNMVPYGGPENKNYTQAAGYVDARDAMYRSISNLITVNSDVFVVNMVVQLQPATNAADAADLAKPRQRWHYVAVIDRGNCFKDGDTPAVLLFSEVK